MHLTCIDSELNINGIFDFPWNRFSELNASAVHVSSTIFFPLLPGLLSFIPSSNVAISVSLCHLTLDIV